MRLENLLALIDARVTNEPCVNSFENIVFESHRVKRGDLFIANSTSEIELAVQNGAYGILYDQPTSIIDNEIAWIYVKNLQEALDKLLRFRLIENEITAYKCNEVVLKLASQIITDDNFVVVTLDNSKLFRQLWQLQNRTILLFCPTLHNENIFTNIKSINSTINKNIEVVEQTLFETSFIYNDKYYERELISPFFIPYLEELFHLYESLNINYRLKKFHTIDNFEAVFTNKKLQIKEFGTSDKVLIFEKNSSLIQKEIEFLQKKAPWANIVYLLPKNIYAPNENNIIRYEKSDEILNTLKNTKFHFALIVGASKSILNKKTNTLQTLFDNEEIQ